MNTEYKLTKRSFRDALAAFGKDEAGVTAIEYGLIAAGIAIAIIATVQSVGTSLNTTFGKVDKALQ